LVGPADRRGWQTLFEGYNAFYGRQGDTALAPAIVESTWQRFLDPSEPMFAFVADDDGALVGLLHAIYHRNTILIEDTCYVQDLFTSPQTRGRGIGTALIEAAYGDARRRGVRRVYWQTKASNLTARWLYERLAEHQGFIVYTHWIPD
jgi:GNAT superfamily N-acetyltransferase